MKLLKTYFLLILGTILVSAANALFLAPNKIVCGGVGGISTILFHMCKIPLGISYAIINILLLILGFKVLGKEFIIKTIIGTVLMSGFTEIMSCVSIVTDNIMLATIFGGLLYGVGLGIIFVIGATTGGTDILGRLIQIKFPHASIGLLMMFLDIIVIGGSLIVFRQIDLILFGVIGVFLQTISLEFLIKKLNVSKIALVISDYWEEINDDLIADFSRGTTLLNAQGGFSKNDKKIVMCALKSNEVEEFRRRVNLIDSDSFVIFTESQFIHGNGFVVYK